MKISSEIYDNFFKFAVVRNPYSRFVSRYNYMKSTNTLKELSFPEFLKKHVELSLIADQQYRFLLNKNGKIGVNKIIKFENINEEMTEFSKANNLKLSKFKKLNISTTENYKDYYDTDTKKIVEDFCKEDLEFFNYSF